MELEDMMASRKGRPVTIIKDHQVIATCSNLGDAMRLTQVCKEAIRNRMKNGGTVKGYRFLDPDNIPNSEQ
jgi:hypothetical protein